MGRYLDRISAGQALAAALGTPDKDTLVLGLPRGGVPVAAEVARALGLALDVLVVRKLGVPGHDELAMGAVAAAGAGGKGVRVLNHGVIQGLAISPVTIDAVTTLERRVVDRRARMLRPGMRPLELTGRDVIVVDDGVATGATARAAIAVAKAAGARHVTFAAPVGPPDAVIALARECDRVVVPMQPEPYGAVATWYERFEAVPEGAIQRLLEEFRARTPEPA